MSIKITLDTIKKSQLNKILNSNLEFSTIIMFFNSLRYSNNFKLNFNKY